MASISMLLAFRLQSYKKYLTFASILRKISRKSETCMVYTTERLT